MTVSGGSAVEHKRKRAAATPPPALDRVIIVNIIGEQRTVEEAVAVEATAEEQQQ